MFKLDTNNNKERGNLSGPKLNNTNALSKQGCAL